MIAYGYNDSGCMTGAGVIRFINLVLSCDRIGLYGKAKGYTILKRNAVVICAFEGHPNVYKP